MPKANYDLISPMDDSTKSIPLQAFPPEAWHELTGTGTGGGFSPITAYRAVPLIFRCVDMRASGVASIPFELYPLKSDNPVTDRPEYAAIVQDMKGLLWLTEAALCIYGRAYWEVARNRVRSKVTPVWMLPTTIKPRKNTAARVVGGGLTGFERKVGQDEPTPYKLDEIVYFHLPSLTDEIEAGVAPVQVALSSAGVLYDIDQFAQAYFKRGVIKATLLVVEGQPQQEEMERLKAWWRSLIRGIKTAFETIAIQQSVKPVVIGSDLKDTQAPELTTQKREDIALAMGVPYTMLFGNAANYATAMSDKLMFHTNIVVPRAEWIAERVNKQLLAPLGIMMEFDPSRLEVMQWSEVQKAQALRLLVGINNPILQVSEAREQLGYDPMTDAVDPDLITLYNRVKELHDQVVGQAPAPPVNGRPAVSTNGSGALPSMEAVNG